MQERRQHGAGPDDDGKTFQGDRNIELDQLDGDQNRHDSQRQGPDSAARFDAQITDQIPQQGDQKDMHGPLHLGQIENRNPQIGDGGVRVNDQIDVVEGPDDGNDRQHPFHYSVHNRATSRQPSFTSMA